MKEQTTNCNLIYICNCIDHASFCFYQKAAARYTLFHIAKQHQVAQRMIFAVALLSMETCRCSNVPFCTILLGFAYTEPQGSFPTKQGCPKKSHQH